MNSMMKYSALFIALVFNNSCLLADIGHFDIYEISWQDRIYYLTFESPGRLQNNDLCYYDYKGTYRMEVGDFVKEQLGRTSEIRLFKELEYILMDSFQTNAGGVGWIESPIYIMKDFFTISPDSLYDNYELLGAKKGNIYGTLASSSLTTADNQWIRNSTMRNIFSVNGGECDYIFYAPAAMYSEEYITELQSELQALMPAVDSYLKLEVELDEEREKEQKFKLRVEELVKKRIIMIGGCSC
ncbi:MAG: hypothetical protein AAGJ93_05630 [Bacteroidota bacterium]